MPLFATARRHFDEDTGRAITLAEHAHTIGVSTLQGDVFRAAWMMSVGACDAFFCDAYADLAARTLQAKNLQPSFMISDRMLRLRIPVIAAMGTAPTENWRWRMAARTMIEEESVLSISEIKGLLNQFCPDKQKIFSNGNYDAWIMHPKAKSRLFGITATDYRKLNNKALSDQRERSIEQFEARFEKLFQRRHDCIHNCDRPKAALDTSDLNLVAIKKVVEDVVFLATRVQEHLESTFPILLDNLSIQAVTKARVMQ
jgi:hypothetical protein